MLDNATIADADADTATVTALIPAANLAGLQDMIAKLNRKARRLNCPEIVIVVGPRQIAEKSQLVIETSIMNAKHRKIRVECFPVTVTGTRPKLPGGWSLVARVQLLDGVSITHSVPGETVPAEFHDCTNRCDHCGHDRRRNDVFVVRNDTAKHMVVGRTCIADFLGGVSPNQLACMAECMKALDLRDFESYGDSTGRHGPDMDVERLITASATAMRVCGGFVSKKAAEFGNITATVTYANNHYHGSLFLDEDNRPTSASHHHRYKTPFTPVTTTPEDEQEAASAIAWAQALNGTATNDYLINCAKVASLSYAPWNLAGIAASIIAAHQREQGRLATRQTERKVSTHQGTVGERITRKLTVVRVNGYETAYGTKFAHSMKDDDGNVFVWFAAGRTVLDAGKTYNVTGTVKRHKEYQGTKQTELTRCKV